MTGAGARPPWHLSFRQIRLSLLRRSVQPLAPGRLRDATDVFTGPWWYEIPSRTTRAFLLRQALWSIESHQRRTAPRIEPAKDEAGHGHKPVAAAGHHTPGVHAAASAKPPPLRTRQPVRPDLRLDRHRLWRHWHRPSTRSRGPAGGLWEAITRTSPGPSRCRAGGAGRALADRLGAADRRRGQVLLILLRADNNGEGGALSLMALAQRTVKKGERGADARRHRRGDVLWRQRLTPAISVLSAMEGLKLITPAFSDYVVPGTVLILVLLFAVQSRGTAKARRSSAR